MVEKDVERAAGERGAEPSGPADGSQLVSPPPAESHEKPGPSPNPEPGTGESRVSLMKRLEFIPKRCRWNKDAPPQFNWPMCFLFAFSSMFTVANLYYNQPILHILAEEFHVDYETSSRVATLMQAGYAGGLLLICPLADIVRRRPMVLGLIFLTANVWLGLCLTTSWQAFQTLSFLAAFTTVTPQVMLPLMARLAPPNRRAMMISVVFGGLFGGVLVARILSGIVTQASGRWRTMYFAAFGIQYLLLVLLFFYFPDYPAGNKPPQRAREQNPGAGDEVVLNRSSSSSFVAVVKSYPHILGSILTIPTRQPALVQTALGSFFANASFVSFWTTLTFLLADPQGAYNLPTLTIGLFALIGMPPFIINPFISHRLVNRTSPIHAALASLLIMLVGVLIGTFVGTFSLAGPIIMGFLIDLGMIMYQTACRTLLVAVEPQASNRVNTVFMVTTFCGMLMGTTVGNSLYAAGGWHYSGYGDIGFLAISIGLLLARGPHETRWVGWRGGWGWREEKGTVSDVSGSGENDEEGGVRQTEVLK